MTRRVGRQVAFAAMGISLGGFAWAAETSSPTIAVEIWATDAKGQPIAPLDAADLEVHQDGVPQTITRLEPRDTPGVYELRYVPTSGQPGPMTIRSARKGLVIRGPGGGGLQPRVIPGRSALEAELLAFADGASRAPALSCELAVFRFGTSPRGSQYVGAVEVGMSDLVHVEGTAAITVGARVTTLLQIVARLRRDDGMDERVASYERAVEGAQAFERLVWTSQYDLREGAYTLETVVRDVATTRVGVRRVGFHVPAPRPGLGMSSVVFLQHVVAEVARASASDDPLMFRGTALLPALGLKLPHQTEAAARFFVRLYPNPTDPAPVTLEMEVLREGQPVGRVPISLPPPADGYIAFVGDLPTRTFRASPYLLRLVARQGEASTTEEATIVISPAAEMPAVRIER